MAVPSDWSLLLRPTPRKVIEAMLAGASTLTEISTATRMSKPALVPHLKKLVALGALRSERVPVAGAVEARYHLNDFSLHLSLRGADKTAIAWATNAAWSPDAPLVAQVPQSVVREEVAGFLRTLNELGPEVAANCVVILFGSGARGEATWKSDVDLIVVTDVAGARKAIEIASAQASIGTQHAIVPTVSTSKDFVAKRKRIFEEAAREGMIVWAPRGDLAPWPKMDRYRTISI